MPSYPPVIGVAVALGAMLAIVYFIQRRLRVGDDPSIRMTSENAAGSTSFLLSGSHAVGFLAMVAAIGLWIGGLWRSDYVLVLTVLAVGYYLLEKREAMREGR